jgi:hypothetical protein
MATTVLEIPNESGIVQKLMFSSIVAHEKVIAITIYVCNEEYVPQKILKTTIDTRNEKDYHTDLRKAAHAKNQYKKEYSTNPEWNENL